MMDDRRASELIESLRGHGIKDARVLDAMAQTPRDAFVDPIFSSDAYADRALPIDCGQTISQPYIVAYMTEALRLDSRMRVLEIGTGSGYQTAVLSRLVRMVYTVERHQPLLKEAEARFRALRLNNIQTRHGDGYQGWREAAPFDRILVTAAFPEVPEALIGQLKPDGILVTPVGYESISQRLLRIIPLKEDAEGGLQAGSKPGYTTETLLPVVFVPMIAGLPKEGRNGDAESVRK
jgi:protein-L-isoaspartate(D-aspartate) O-methyltransferase